MALAVVALLVLVWGSILGPDLVRARRRVPPSSSISEFEQHMSMLAPERLGRARDMHHPRPGRRILVVTNPSSLMGIRGPATRGAVHRRRQTLGVLLAAVVVTAVLAAVVAAAWTTWLAAAAGVALLGYCAILRSHASHEASTRRTVRRIDPQRRRRPARPPQRRRAVSG